MVNNSFHNGLHILDFQIEDGKSLFQKFFGFKHDFLLSYIPFHDDLGVKYNNTPKKKYEEKKSAVY